MASNEWARERANAVARSVWPYLADGFEDDVTDAILAALQEAEQRGRKSAIEARGEEYGHIIAGVGYNEGRQSILDRLKEPNEALMQVLAQKISGLVEFDTNEDEATDILRALATALAKPNTEKEQE